MLDMYSHLSSTLFFFLMIRRPPRSTLHRSSAASDVYKRQFQDSTYAHVEIYKKIVGNKINITAVGDPDQSIFALSLIHISEPTRPY